jgi:23S rRNA pseudouridine2605 synthase
VGRLDKSSEGLMLVTNDGPLANRLTHPRYEIEKTYHVEVIGQPDADSIRKIREGIHLAEAYVKPASIRVKRRLKNITVLEMVLKEGRNREIRRVLARMGHKVVRLRRIGMGMLRLGEMPSGAYRPLTASEVKDLRKSATEENAKPAPRQRRRPEKSSSDRPRTAGKGAPKSSSDRPRTAGKGAPKSSRRPAAAKPDKQPDKRAPQGAGRPTKFKPAEEFSDDSAELIGFDGGGVTNRSHGSVIGEEQPSGSKKRPSRKKTSPPTGKRKFGKNSKEATSTTGVRPKKSKKSGKGAKSSKTSVKRSKTGKKSTNGAKASGKRGASKGKVGRGRATTIKGKGAKKTSRKKHR